VQFKHDPARLDKTAAVLTSCISLVAPANAAKRKPRSEVFWNIAGSVADTAADLCINPVHAACNAKLFVGNVNAFKVISKMTPVLDAAGINMKEVVLK